MPPILEPLILAVVQGLTEFLPVSSSGHLVLLQTWFGAAEGDLFLDVVLHVGTLGSVLWVYRREVRRLLLLDRPARAYVAALAIGTVPAVVVGLTLADTVERLFASPLAAAVALFVTAAILATTRWVDARDDRAEQVWTPAAPSPGRALLIGCAQAVAITPGLSRSGATIAASLWSGLARVEAARFSFLLSVPAIGGALVLHLLKGEVATRTSTPGLLLAAGIAFLVGLVAIRLTALAVVARHFWKFSFYCLALGAVVLVALGT